MVFLMITDNKGKILFSDKELACRHCGKLHLAPGFAEKLKELRLDVGLPMIVNSCCRCPKHNKAVKGSPRSFHLTDNLVYGTLGTCAIDIARRGYEADRQVITAALVNGWSVGIAKTFIHLDRRTDYTNLKAVIFTY